jgi:hypothetical protein
VSNYREECGLNDVGTSQTSTTTASYFTDETTLCPSQNSSVLITNKQTGKKKL